VAHLYAHGEVITENNIPSSGGKTSYASTFAAVALDSTNVASLHPLRLCSL